MELNDFKKYVGDADIFTVREIEEFTFMSYSEVKDYQRGLEKDNGNLSNWDHLRAFLTLKHKLEECEYRIDDLESEVKMWKSNCYEHDDDDDDEMYEEDIDENDVK